MRHNIRFYPSLVRSSLLTIQNLSILPGLAVFGSKMGYGLYNKLNLAANTIQAGHGLFNQGYSAYNTLRNVFAPTSAAGSGPVSSRRFYGGGIRTRGRRTYGRKKSFRKRVVRSGRKVLRRKTSSSKSARKARKMTGSSRVPSLYKKKFKPMRRFNRGRLALQNRLQMGLTLPNRTFARFFWRTSCECNTFSANPKYSGAAILPSDIALRTMIIDNLEHRFTPSSNVSTLIGESSAWPNPTVYNKPVWYNLMTQLYNQYMVLGSKLTITIKPTTFPDYTPSALTLAHVPVPNTTWATLNSLPLNVKAGFWYVRCFYTRYSGLSGGQSDQVGHFISHVATNPSTSMTDAHTEQWWPTMREFLNDPTVTWKRDKTVVRQKLQVHSERSVDPVTRDTSFPGTNTTTREIECSTRPVTLTVNFSNRKHYGNQDPTRSRQYQTFGSGFPTGTGSTGSPGYFNVRWGYAAFNDNDECVYQVPLSRNPRVSVDYEIKYFVSLQDPRIGPDDPVPVVAPAMMKEFAGEDDIDDDEFVRDLLDPLEEGEEVDSEEEPTE